MRRSIAQLSIFAAYSAALLLGSPRLNASQTFLNCLRDQIVRSSDPRLLVFETLKKKYGLSDSRLPNGFFEYRQGDRVLMNTDDYPYFRGKKTYVLGEGSYGKVFRVQSRDGHETVIKWFKQDSINKKGPPESAVQTQLHAYNFLREHESALGVKVPQVKQGPTPQSLEIESIRGLPLNQVLNLPLPIKLRSDLLARYLVFATKLETFLFDHGIPLHSQSKTRFAIQLGEKRLELPAQFYDEQIDTRHRVIYSNKMDNIIVDPMTLDFWLVDPG